MLFSSLEFLYLFLPITLMLYFLSPLRWRNVALLVVSLIFYGIGEPIYVVLMLLTIAADYLFGLAIERAFARKGNARVWLFGAVAWNLITLAFFKYYDFIASSLSLPTLGLSLPIGISFYTFQAMSYVIDVYRREVRASRDPIAFGTYVALFPQLIAGPIVRYSEIDGQLQSRRHSWEQASQGAATFCAGLAKKVLLANTAGEMGGGLLALDGGQTVLGTWLWLILYSFQIYFDFSGYSDMAVGLGRILGFSFPENFRYPYISQSITEFWRRWHITLSTWFRCYVYIPLGGNRRGSWQTCRNLFIVWLLTGLWHGAAWNFLLWGLYFFCILLTEKLFLGKLLEKMPRVLRHLYALVLIAIGWLIFASDGSLATRGVTLLGSLFGLGAVRVADARIGYELARMLPALLIMALGAIPLPKRVFALLCRRFPRGGVLVGAALCSASLVLCTAYLVDGGYNPFLYFRF